MIVFHIAKNWEKIYLSHDTLCGGMRDGESIVSVPDMLEVPLDETTDVLCPKCANHPDYFLLVLAHSP